MPGTLHTIKKRNCTHTQLMSFSLLPYIYIYIYISAFFYFILLMSFPFPFFNSNILLSCFVMYSCIILGVVRLRASDQENI